MVARHSNGQRRVKQRAPASVYIFMKRAISEHMSFLPSMFGHTEQLYFMRDYYYS